MALINDFIAQIKEGGLARTNRYIVDFRPPVAGDDDTKRKLVLFCDQVQIPGQNFSTVQNRVFGEFREVPYERIYDNITLSFLVDSGMNVKKVFDKWMDKIADPYTRTYGYYKDYTVDMTIEVQDVVDQTRYRIKLFECYPKTVSTIQLDYNSKDIMKLKVAMQYKYWTSDATTVLQNSQVINANMLDSYMNQFNKFQDIFSNFSLGDAENFTTGLANQYAQNWISDNIPGIPSGFIRI